jgi:pyruvate-formate lyase-activating enzyme
MESIKASWLENALCPRVRVSVVPHNTTKLSDIKNVVRFIFQYAEDHAILLPGRIPGYKRDDLQLLPSLMTKQEVWEITTKELQHAASPRLCAILSSALSGSS